VKSVLASNRIRLQRILREAEGYLELGMPRQALALLERIEQPGTFKGEMLYLKGEALRSLENYQDAVPLLVDAVDLKPSNIHAWMALGWCYKRTGRLDDAIDSLERAHEVEPSEPLIDYNLACYYSLKGVKQRALDYLTRAINVNPRFKDLVGGEPDFDPIRSDPGFQALVSVIV
jgi:Flp pilus assembly protein TadD